MTVDTAAGVALLARIQAFDNPNDHRMEQAIERRLTRQVVRAVARDLAASGLSLTTPMFLTRGGELITPFVHFHKFRFKPGFRIHLGIRVMNDPFDAISLNGPYEAELGEFSEREEDVRACVERMVAYCRRAGLPWIERWSDAETLLAARGSPLDRDERSALRDALAGRADPAQVLQSKRLLGLLRTARSGRPRPVV